MALTATMAMGQGTPDDLRGNGAYDTVEIAGFLIPIDDIERLSQAGILRLNPQSGRFGFDRAITSEWRLNAALRDMPLQDARALRDLYRAGKVALPNGAAHTLSVPSGFGPAHFSNQRGGLALGVGVGGVSRVPYTNSPDGGIGFGLSFGNAFENLGVGVGLSMNDMSDAANTDRMSLGFKISRYISDGLSVSVGGENLLVKDTDGEDSYFAVASWAFARDGAVFPFDGVATIGVGSGRFANMTAADRAAGKGKDATAIFGALAWELDANTNLIADWNGRNLSIGGAWRLTDTGISVKLGLRDLTGHSGDGPRLMGSVGMTLLQF